MYGWQTGRIRRMPRQRAKTRKRVREPVGMAHCGNPAAMRGQDARRTLRAELSSVRMADWTHTANAATASENAEADSRACRHGSLRQPHIHARTGCQADTESGALKCTDGRLDAYGECRDSERKRGSGFASLSAWLIEATPHPCVARMSYRH